MRIYYCQEEAPKDSIVCVFYVLLSITIIRITYYYNSFNIGRNGDRWSSKI